MFLNSDPNCLNLLSCKDPSEDEFTRLKDVLLQFKNKKNIYINRHLQEFFQIMTKDFSHNIWDTHFWVHIYKGSIWPESPSQALALI